MTLPSAAQSTRPPSFLTYAQLIISILGVLVGITFAVLLFVAGLFILVGNTADASTLTGVFAMFWTTVMVTLLLLPSLLLSFNRLGYTSIPIPRIPSFGGWKELLAVLAAWVVILILGYLAAQQENLAWLLLPPLQIFAIGLPIMMFIRLAHQKLENGPRRSWGMVSFSEVITTPLVIVVELVFMALLVVMFLIFVIGQPDILYELQQLGQQLQTMEQPSPELILPLVQPYLENPAVIFAIFAVLSGLVPLIEELLKPMAVWFLVGRRLTPAQGFISGAVCGGIFALLESLLSVTQPGDGWLTLAMARSGTGLLHITTTALVGMSIASAWQYGKYWRLALNFLIAVTIHGLWNALSVVSALIGVRQMGTGGAGLLDGLAVLAPVFGLALLAVGILVLLLSLNRRLQKTMPVSEPVIIDP